MPALQPGEQRECKCGTKFVGARSSSNPRTVMPVTLEPHEKGNVLLQQKGGVLTAFVFGSPVIRGALHDAGVVMRVSHFADCPHAADFHR